MNLIMIKKSTSTMITKFILVKIFPKVVIFGTVLAFEFVPSLLIAIDIIVIPYQRVILLHLWISLCHHFHKFVPMEDVCKDISDLCFTTCCDGFGASVIVSVVKDTQVLKYLILTLIYNRVC